MSYMHRADITFPHYFMFDEKQDTDLMQSASLFSLVTELKECDDWDKYLALAEDKIELVGLTDKSDFYAEDSAFDWYNNCVNDVSVNNKGEFVVSCVEINPETLFKSEENAEIIKEILSGLGWDLDEDFVEDLLNDKKCQKIFEEAFK